MIRFRSFVIAVFVVLSLSSVCAQQFALKTNIFQWATASPNIGFEAGLSPRWTINVFGSYNPFTMNSEGLKWKHWLVQPEARYWFCERFNGHFLGVHLLGGQYNAGGVKLPFGIFPELAEHRFQGWLVGGGVSYGYQWLMSKRWSFELSLGVGYLYVDYDKFFCVHCGTPLAHGVKHYFGPTKLAVSFLYFL